MTATLLDEDEGGPFVSFDEAKSALGIPVHDTTDDLWIASCVRAVNEFVMQSRSDLRTINADSETWIVDARTRWGAAQLVTRWYARRNSTDISAFTELGGPPPSIDRDVAVALRIDRYFRPVVS